MPRRRRGVYSPTAGPVRPRTPPPSRNTAAVRQTSPPPGAPGSSADYIAVAPHRVSGLGPRHAGHSSARPPPTETTPNVAPAGGAQICSDLHLRRRASILSYTAQNCGIPTLHAHNIASPRRRASVSGGTWLYQSELPLTSASLRRRRRSLRTAAVCRRYAETGCAASTPGQTMPVLRHDGLFPASPLRRRTAPNRGQAGRRGPMPTQYLTLGSGQHRGDSEQYHRFDPPHCCAVPRPCFRADHNRPAPPLRTSTMCRTTASRTPRRRAALRRCPVSCREPRPCLCLTRDTRPFLCLRDDATRDTRPRLCYRPLPRATHRLGGPAP